MYKMIEFMDRENGFASSYERRVRAPDKRGY